MHLFINPNLSLRNMKEDIDQLDKILSLCEDPVLSIAKELREEGYEIAGCMGVRQKTPPCNLIGILKEREPIQKDFYGILKWNKNQRALHLGTILLNCKKEKAEEGEKWVLEVYGREYLLELTEVVKRLSLPYKAKIQVKLCSDFPREENYLHELGSF